MPFSGGQETPIAATALGSFWADPTTVALSTRSPAGTELTLVDINSRLRRSRFTVPDSDLVDFSLLPGGGWAWIPAGGRNVHVHSARDARERAFKIPSWYARAIGLTHSPDGKKLAFLGWSAPSEDSLGLSILDLTSGAVTPLLTSYAENGYAKWLPDGSIMLVQWETQESASVFRVSESGQAVRIGTFPRAVASVTVSSDMKRAAIVLRDYHGDAWMSRVVRH
jgi:hypothetical protein